VEVPAGVCLNGVEAAFLQFGEAVRPVFTGNAEVVHSAGYDGVRLAVKKKILVVVSENCHFVFLSSYFMIKSSLSQIGRKINTQARLYGVCMRLGNG
jgi:hypothetical protein